MLSDSDLAPAAPMTWEQLRRQPSSDDLLLSEQASLWLSSLAAALRPVLLPAEHPRIANRLASVWHDTVACRNALEELLTDHRGGRQGFSPFLQAELQQLFDYVQGNLDWMAGNTPA